MEITILLVLLLIGLFNLYSTLRIPRVFGLSFNQFWHGKLLNRAELTPLLGRLLGQIEQHRVALKPTVSITAHAGERTVGYWQKMGSPSGNLIMAIFEKDDTVTLVPDDPGSVSSTMSRDTFFRTYKPAPIAEQLDMRPVAPLKSKTRLADEPEPKMPEADADQLAAEYELGKGPSDPKTHQEP